MDDGLSIAQVAERTGLTAHTLRYYERAGLMLTAPPRGGNGYRRYGDTDVRWIALLTRLRATGMRIGDMRRYAELQRAGEQTVAERRDLIVAHREHVLSKIAQLEGDLVAVDEKIAYYDKLVERDR